MPLPAPLDPSRLQKEDLAVLVRDVQRFMFGVFDDRGNLVGWSSEEPVPGAEFVDWMALRLDQAGLYPGQRRKQDWEPPGRGPGGRSGPAGPSRPAASER